MGGDGTKELSNKVLWEPKRWLGLKSRHNIRDSGKDDLVRRA